MAFFDQVYDRLFPQKPKGIILHEVISRSAEYQARFESWKKSYKSSDLLKEVSTGYASKLVGIECEPNVHILKDKYSSGFAVSYNERIGKEYFQFMFDFLAERGKSQGYKVANSDWIVTEREEYTETVEKHYLKPETGTEVPVDQQYGNILVEHILIDDQPSFIRLIVNGYSDRHYLPPRPFNDLLSKLLN